MDATAPAARQPAPALGPGRFFAAELDLEDLYVGHDRLPTISLDRLDVLGGLVAAERALLTELLAVRDDRSRSNGRSSVDGHDVAPDSGASPDAYVSDGAAAQPDAEPKGNDRGGCGCATGPVTRRSGITLEPTMLLLALVVLRRRRRTPGS